METASSYHLALGVIQDHIVKVKAESSQIQGEKGTQSCVYWEVQFIWGPYLENNYHSDIDSSGH